MSEVATANLVFIKDIEDSERIHSPIPRRMLENGTREFFLGSGVTSPVMMVPSQVLSLKDSKNGQRIPNGDGMPHAYSNVCSAIYIFIPLADLSLCVYV